MKALNGKYAVPIIDNTVPYAFYTESSEGAQVAISIVNKYIKAEDWYLQITDEKPESTTPCEAEWYYDLKTNLVSGIVL